MDDTASKENPSKDFNKLDLSQLQGFSFGTQWTQDKDAARDQRREGRGRRDDGAEHREGGEHRRDRRSFRKPAGGPAHDQPPSDTAGEGGGQQRRSERGPRRDFRAGGESRGQGQGAAGQRRDFHGGQRREGQGGERAYGQGERGGFRGGFHGRRDAQPEHRGAYISPYFNVIFYPEDSGFSALAKAIRSSCRTYELFEIARVIVGKTDRFVATIQRKQPGGPQPGRPAPAQKKAPEGSENAADAPEADAPQSAPAKTPPLAISIPDGLPFENEDAVIAHVLAHHLDKFFDSAEVEVEAPKGNFLVINKCGLTGELLGPPNYHRYNQIVQQHHATRVARMPFEVFRNRIETLRDPDVVNQWLEKMKKTTRYTWKFTPPAEGAEPLSFDSLDDARAYLLSNARDKVVKLVETARFHGKLLDVLPQGEIRRAIEGALERQRRFPLDTANALRGRLRREGFTIFKKGSKGISYVCAVKRKFRVPGQTFSDSIGALIAFIEANPMVKASELPVKFLGIHPPAQPAQPAAPAPEQPAPAAETAPADAETASGETVPPANEPQPPAQPEAEAAAPGQTGDEAQPAAETAESSTPAAADASAALPRPSGSVAPFTGNAAATELSAEDKSRLHTLTGDLHWLVSEGYVTEFIDGRLFAPPPMTEARKQEVEKEEHDPENFPDAPVSEESSAPAATEAASEAGPVPAEPDAPSAEAAAPAEPAPESDVPAAGTEPAPESSPAAEPAPEEPPKTE
ncbi:hypothetical protein OH491_25325 [Termitidicoccus mucosus]|uniref:Uncharacterized protein n=1 Tax=Termitidicoccus mucosus TaxID=1184151 RepID=A0A178IRG0_9BACT|nr:hypothetical protein AW736_01225 [Opitutaceae bacterium TSB47]